MLKLTVSGWCNFIMLLPLSLFEQDPDTISETLLTKLKAIDSFQEALLETEIYNIWTIDVAALIKDKQISFSGDNGNIEMKLSDVEDFEVIF